VFWIFRCIFFGRGCTELRFIADMSTAAPGLAYGFGRDYTKGFGHETHFEKIEKLAKLLLDKLNHFLQDVRMGCERVGEIYSLDFAVDAEPASTTLERMRTKAEACKRRLKQIEGLLTNVKEPPLPKLADKNVPKNDDVENMINAWLEMMDRNGAIIEDAVHSINDKCAMNIRLEPKLEEPYLDMKQFITAVICKWQRLSFSWQMVQIMVVTNNIDIEKASPQLLQDAQNLKALYDNGFLKPEDYAERRLQILDKMFMRQKDTDREDRKRWMLQAYNMKDLYGERKAQLPGFYDRDGVHREYDFYDKDKAEDEEVRRLRLLALVEHDANTKNYTPVLLNNDMSREVEKKKFSHYAGAVVEKNVSAPPKDRAAPPPRQDFATLAPTVVNSDLDERRRKYEEQQRQAEEQRRQRQQDNGNSNQSDQPVSPRAKAAPMSMPASTAEIDAFKRAMIDKYEQQQRENAELLRKRKEQQNGAH